MKIKDLIDEYDGLPIHDFAQERAKIEKKKLADRQLMIDYAETFQSPAGMRVLWDLLTFCHIFDIVFTGNSRTFFNDGERSVGLYLLSMLEIGKHVSDIEKLKLLKPKENQDGRYSIIHTE